MKVEISREYEFAAAHELPFHTGKCQRLHGHNYGLTVTVSGSVRADGGSSHGMVMDFGDVDTGVQFVLDTLDHQFLNKVLSRYPTAEVVAMWIFETLERQFEPYDVVLEAVRLSETPRSWAEVTR